MDWKIETAEYAKMIQHCIDGFPLEACGLFLGPADDQGAPIGGINKIWPAVNAEASARIYTVDSKDMFEASRWASENNMEIVGVFHSHTHTRAYPSRTDVSQAVDQNWLYTIVSLADEKPIANSFQIINGEYKELLLDVVA